MGTATMVAMSSHSGVKAKKSLATIPHSTMGMHTKKQGEEQPTHNTAVTSGSRGRL
jgi:hypothetical protein